MNLIKFKENNVYIDDIFYSPFHPIFGIGDYKKDSYLRKPNPGMLLEAQKKHKINLQTSILIGDKKSDIEAGKSAGIQTNILFSDDILCKDSIAIKHLSEASNYI